MSDLSFYAWNGGECSEPVQMLMRSGYTSAGTATRGSPTFPVRWLGADGARIRPTEPPPVPVYAPTEKPEPDYGDLPRPGSAGSTPIPPPSAEPELASTSPRPWWVWTGDADDDNDWGPLPNTTDTLATTTTSSMSEDEISMYKFLIIGVTIVAVLFTLFLFCM